MDQASVKDDGAGKYVAIDCEMVGVGEPPSESQLARVSIVSYHGVKLLDTYVRPVMPVTDYRTFVSGIRPHHLRVTGPAISFAEAQKAVADILRGRILVGHALKNDLHALLLTHPGTDIRDTAHWPHYREIARSKTPGLKKLAKAVLGLDIQHGEHDSIDDARIAMDLFKVVKKDWDAHIARGGSKSRPAREVRNATPRLPHPAASKLAA